MTVLAASLLLALLQPEAEPRPPVDGGRVGLVAPGAGRLVQQLRRELKASGFQVVAVAAGTEAALAAAGVDRAVVVTRAGDQVLLLDRRAGRLTSEALPVDRADELSSRRVSLAVVEHLRGPPPAPPPATAGAASAAAPAPAPSAPAAATRAALAPDPPPPPRARPWSFGAATSLAFDGGTGESTGHLQLVGETALPGPLLGSVRVHWPMLGAQLHLPDRRVRLWTLGLASGLRLRLPSWGRLQPLLGATGGLRLVLTDTDWYDPRQSRVALSPALCGGAFAGARYTLAPLVHASLELGSEWARPLGDPTFPYQRDATSSRATRVALGVVFEY